MLSRTLTERAGIRRSFWTVEEAGPYCIVSSKSLHLPSARDPSRCRPDAVILERSEESHRGALFKDDTGGNAVVKF